MVFGISNDGTVVGTNVNIDAQKVGTDRFLFWLRKYLEPKINVQHHKLSYNGKQVEMLCIEPGYQRPLQFKHTTYIRVDSGQQPLARFPEIERAIWQITSRYSFETTIIQSNAQVREVIEKFEYKDMLELLGKKHQSLKGAMDHLQATGMLQLNLQGRYDIAALMGMMCASRMDDFSLLERKTPHVITYEGASKLRGLDDVEDARATL